ncbi:MAG: MipA/OmpV family protein [Rhodanobacter sp.]
MSTRRSLFAAACFLGTISAQAQDASGRPDTSGWRLGAMALVRDGGYVDDVNHSLVVPALGYEGEHVFFRGLQLGWHAWRDDGLQLDLVAQARLEGFDARDIPIAGLEDRRASMDLGTVLALSGDAGKLEFTALADALARSGGQELALNYGYPLKAGRMRITPQIGVRWWSRDLADYYYGIRAREVAHGAPAVHAVSSAVVPEVGINVISPLSRRWALWGVARYQRLPATISDSPLVSKSSASILLVGVSYAF